MKLVLARWIAPEARGISLIQEEFTATSGTGRAHFGWLTNHANAIGMFGHWNDSGFVLHHSALANMWQWLHRGFLTVSNAGAKI